MPGNWFSKFKESLGGEDKQKKKLYWIVLLGVLGILLLVLPSFHVKEEVPDDSDHTSMTVNTPNPSGELSMMEYEKRYEEQLADALGKLAGVEDVSVVVNLDSSEEEVVAMDERQTEQVTTEADKKGGNRSVSQNSNDKKTAYYRTEKGDKPVVIKKVKPHVRGVLVVARGVENLQTRAIVLEAVQRTLDVPIHRISVLPKG